ncbi:SHOCT domain-containing protein [Paradesulfitobacterium ferrireducens]|uniref:SHOCT domain-containing protein n=1 Tax=Paradesulfitobacterium ferrireducens TaxID=2816476 RepID=UPI0038B281E5
MNLNSRNKGHNHSSKAPVGHSKDSSLDLLRERYSRGEIDSEEYNRRKHDLSAE